MKNIYIFFLTALLITPFAGCEKAKHEDIPPPELQIITEDDTGTLGELTVEVYYEDRYGQPHPAPSYTDVYLYASYNDWYDNIPFLKTYTYMDNSIYFGFLDPIYDFYVYAYVEHDYKEYEASQRVMIYAGKHTTAQVFMEEIVTPPQSK